jgi:hypothetical protein
MSEHELKLVQLGRILAQVARPHRCDDALPEEVQARLWQLGLACSETTSREQLVARLWARKRSLLMTARPQWGGGPGVTPPSAA